MIEARQNLGAFNDAVASLPDDALTPLRTAGLQHFLKSGFPTLKDEDWKYTDLSNVLDISQRWLASGVREVDVDDAIVREILASVDAGWIVITHGRIRRGWTTKATRSPQVVMLMRTSPILCQV